MADQNLIPSVSKALQDRAVSLKVILPSGITSTQDYVEIRKGLRPGFELGLLNEVRVGLAMNEKVAGFSLPALGGRIDFLYGFKGSSPSFHKWCHDLFEFYWNQSDLSGSHR